MVSLNEIILSFALFGLVSCLPDCMVVNKTCQLDSTKFVQPPKSMLNWQDCRDFCNDETGCVEFTFFGQNGAPFQNLCFVLNQLCDDYYKGICFPEILSQVNHLEKIRKLEKT